MSLRVMFLFFVALSLCFNNHHLVHDFYADACKRLFVFLDVVAQLSEHVRLDLQLHHLFSRSFYLAFRSMLCLDQLLHPFLLPCLCERDLQPHLRSINGNDLLEFLDEFQSLLLCIMLRVYLYVSFVHSLHDYADRELLPIRSINTLLRDYVGYLLLQVV